MDKLQKRLRTICMAYHKEKGPKGRSDSTKRMAMLQTLDAVMAHLEAQPGYHAADTALLMKVVEFLYNTENGHRTSWAVPDKGRKPQGKPLNITAGRAMAAAMWQKRCDKGEDKEEAARAVFRECAPGLSRGGRGSTLAVMRWHEWIMGALSDSDERQIYNKEMQKK
jgi:hypothetical protein